MNAISELNKGKTKPKDMFKELKSDHPLRK